MSSWRAIAGTLFSPLATFRNLAERPRTLLALVLVVLGQLALPLALSGRLDVRAQALREQGPHLADMTDREVDEAVTQKQKLTRVMVTANALLLPPLRALLLAIALWLWGRYLGGKPAFGALYALCTHAQLPFALRGLAQAAVVLGRPRVAPEELPALLPSGLAPLFHLSPPWMRALGGADFFLLWTAALLGVALCAAARLSARRAALGMTLAYAAYVAVFLVGLPGLGGF